MRTEYFDFLFRAVLAPLVLLWCVPQAPAQTGSSAGKPQAPPAQAQASPAASLGVYVYPQNGQPAAQQQKDEAECYSWAREKTGIDPAAPAPAASTSKPPAQAPKGGAVKGAAHGAAAGAAVGAVADDAGQGAAVGATAGAIRGRRTQKKAEQQAQKQAKADAQTAQQQQLGKFRNAFSACLDGRHYSVK